MFFKGHELAVMALIVVVIGFAFGCWTSALYYEPYKRAISAHMQANHPKAHHER